jgi:hypothetical protein
MLKNSFPDIHILFDDSVKSPQATDHKNWGKQELGKEKLVINTYFLKFVSHGPHQSLGLHISLILCIKPIYMHHYLKYSIY